MRPRSGIDRFHGRLSIRAMPRSSECHTIYSTHDPADLIVKPLP